MKKYIIAILLLTCSTITSAQKVIEVVFGYAVVPSSNRKLIEEVIIKGGSIRIKGDTTSYRASDYKVDVNANVEELLKKLPVVINGKKFINTITNENAKG